MTKPSVIANRIPRDVIREILSHLKSTLFTHELDKFPWYLGHICTAWRAEFLPLCNTISIRFNPRFSPLCSGPERVLGVLRWFLDYNSNTPFSFTLCKHSYASDQLAYVRRALVMLCEQSVCWLDASLYIFKQDIDALYQVKNRIPLLRALTLDDGLVDLQTDSDIFFDAPVLSKLGLRLRTPWNFPWASLMSLSFDVIMDEQFDTLSETVNLEELTISGMHFIKHVVYNKQVILPRLARLFISGTAALEILRTPALVHLSIDAPNTDSFSAVVESFFHASGCKLHQLETRLYSTSNFMDLVECTPDLQRLHTDCIVDIIAVLQNLMAADSRTTPLSHLQSIRLDYPIDSDKLHQQLCAFVKSRSRQVESEVGMFVERFRTLVIVGRDDQDRTKLEKVCDECGVQLRFFESEDDISDRWW